MKKFLAMLLALMMLLAVTGCGKSEAATAVDDQILAIGTVTLDSEKAISAAEDAYDALEDKDKEDIENYEVLTAARAEYDKLLKEHNTKLAKESAAEVDSLIEAIGEVTLDSQEAITAARTAYNNANAEAKGYVTKLSDLENAESTLKTLRKDFADKKLAKMIVQKDAVQKINFYYHTQFPYYKSQNAWAADKRCFVLPYIGIQGNNVWMRLVCNYTYDSWVFFENITFCIDGKNQYKTFNYFDVTRDNAWGDVWEYVDLDVGSSEIALLTEIANSKETIVRFEGDNYYYDFTVSQKDKDCIKETLAVYEALK